MTEFQEARPKRLEWTVGEHGTLLSTPGGYLVYERDGKWLADLSVGLMIAHVSSQEKAKDMCQQDFDGFWEEMTEVES